MDDQEQGKRTAKATVFEDIFSDPAYRLQLVQALHPEMKEKKWDIYGTKALPLPEPEFYVIYTGKRKRRPRTISFSSDFFGGKKAAIDITAKVLKLGRTAAASAE